MVWGETVLTLIFTAFKFHKLAAILCIKFSLENLQQLEH